MVFVEEDVDGANERSMDETIVAKWLVDVGVGGRSLS